MCLGRASSAGANRHACWPLHRSCAFWPITALRCRLLNRSHRRTPGRPFACSAGATARRQLGEIGATSGSADAMIGCSFVSIRPFSSFVIVLAVDTCNTLRAWRMNAEGETPESFELSFEFLCGLGMAAPFVCGSTLPPMGCECHNSTRTRVWVHW